MFDMNKNQDECIRYPNSKLRQYVALFAMILITLLFAKVFANTASATEEVRTGRDLHRLWDSNCVTCHGHSADFSRKFLKVSDGKLLGPLYGNNLRLFLHNHYLAGKEVDAIYNMLLAQVGTQPRFHQECSGCHATAAKFVRESLILRDGELYSRNLENSISSFLASHRKLNEQDVSFFVELLTRVAHEVYRP